MEAPKREFPLDANGYKLYEEIGEGVSASVHRALYISLNEIVVIKVLDLEKCNNDFVSSSLFQNVFNVWFIKVFFDVSRFSHILYMYIVLPKSLLRFRVIHT